MLVYLIATILSSAEYALVSCINCVKGGPWTSKSNHPSIDVIRPPWHSTQCTQQSAPEAARNATGTRQSESHPSFRYNSHIHQEPSYCLSPTKILACIPHLLLQAHVKHCTGPAISRCKPNKHLQAQRQLADCRATKADSHSS